MKLIVGLGNPGPAYVQTRHNLGFRVIDELARLAGVALRQRVAYARVGQGRLDDILMVLAKPQTFMNKSGVALAALLRLYPSPDTHPDHLIVLHDDLDLPVGRVRIKTRGSDGGHRGIRSIIQALGTDRFIRVKIGIGKPAMLGAPVTRDPAAYVLSTFTEDERPVVETAVKDAARAVQGILTHGAAGAASRFHQ